MNPIMIALMAALMELLKNCPEKRAERVMAHFQNPGPLIRLRIEGQARRQLNLSPSDWRSHAKPYVDQFYGEGRAATVEDVQELLEMSQAA